MHGKWGYHGYRVGKFHHHHWGGGLFFLPGLLLMGVLAFVLLKFLWPVLLIGLLIAAFRWMKHGGHGPRRWDSGEHDWSEWAEQWKRDWDDKRKRSDYVSGEKPKRRYSQTEDGEWVEIV
jgi:hypothetical protein